MSAAETEGEPGVPAQPTPASGSGSPLGNPLSVPLTSCPASSLVPAAAEAELTDDLMGAAEADGEPGVPDLSDVQVVRSGPPA